MSEEQKKGNKDEKKGLIGTLVNYFKKEEEEKKEEEKKEEDIEN